MSKTYEIVRFYAEDGHPDHGKIIKSGLTIEEAKEHCQDPDTEEKGVWFDGFREEQFLSPRNPADNGSEQNINL